VRTRSFLISEYFAEDSCAFAEGAIAAIDGTQKARLRTNVVK
jgi:hypothetical protein